MNSLIRRLGTNRMIPFKLISIKNFLSNSIFGQTNNIKDLNLNYLVAHKNILLSNGYASTFSIRKFSTISKSKSKYKNSLTEEIFKTGEEPKNKNKKLNASLKEPSDYDKKNRSSKKTDEIIKINRYKDLPKTGDNVLKNKFQNNKKIDIYSIYKIGSVEYNSELDPIKYTLNPQGIYLDYISTKSTIKTRNQINCEKQFVGPYDDILPIISSGGNGSYIRDIDGINYIDFVSSNFIFYPTNSINIINSAKSHMSKINMTSRGFFNEVVASAENLICKLFKYEKVLLMNSKKEAEQTAIEIGRRWGHKEKNIATDKTKIVFANRNSRETSSHDNESLQNNSHEILEEHYHSRNYLVDYGNFEQIKEIIEKDSNICAVFMEPIQLENGVNIPEPDYFDQLSKLCKKHDVLLIMDETQTGLGRTGYLLCSQMHKVIPDIVLLGETLCGGIYPISAVITTNKIMDKIKPYDYISTYETNPLAAIISTLTIEELFTDSFITNSFYRGIEFGVLLKEKLISNRFIKEVRGRGLIYAIELWPECGYSAYDFSLWFLERGILSKPSNNYTLKLCAPHTITSEETTRCAEIISTVLNNAQRLNQDFKPTETILFNLHISNKYQDELIEKRTLNLNRNNESLLLEKSRPFISYTINPIDLYTNPTKYDELVYKKIL